MLHELRLDADCEGRIFNCIIIASSHVIDEDWTGQFGRLLDLADGGQGAPVFTCWLDGVWLDAFDNILHVLK